MNPSTLPDKGSQFWNSPALQQQSKHYPVWYEGRVPMRIRMLETVRPDLICGLLPDYVRPGTILFKGMTYECWTNSHGAISGICENGFKLGVKPHEFEVVEWYEPTYEKN